MVPVQKRPDILNLTPKIYEKTWIPPFTVPLAGDGVVPLRLNVFVSSVFCSATIRNAIVVEINAKIPPRVSKPIKKNCVGIFSIQLANIFSHEVLMHLTNTVRFLCWYNIVRYYYPYHSLRKQDQTLIRNITLNVHTAEREECIIAGFAYCARRARRICSVSKWTKPPHCPLIHIVSTVPRRPLTLH